MKEREALKLAREHIEGNYTVSADEALAAIKEALAHPDRIIALRQKTKSHDVDCLCSDCNELDDLEDVLTQPEQFWHHDCPDSGETATEKGKPCNWCGAVEAQPKQEPVAIDGLLTPKVNPLNTLSSPSIHDVLMKSVVQSGKVVHPPQRTWVGLTDEEKCEIERELVNTPKAGTSTLVNLIEAKLKEKNT